ncbi:MAG: DUF5714 domain-containing protein [Candidatus Bathyarchaeia archaeon]
MSEEVKEVTIEELKNTPRYELYRKMSAMMKGSPKPGRYVEFLPTVFNTVLAAREKDPVIMFERVIDELRGLWNLSPRMPVSGPWHHAIVPGVLIASLRNNGYPFTDEDVEEALKRGSLVPAAACGFLGACGAAVGLGIAVSIITKATPYHDKERSLTLKYSAEAITLVARHGGPHCCRLASYVVILHAVRVFEKEFGYKLSTPSPGGLVGRCTLWKENPVCLMERCMFNPLVRKIAEERKKANTAKS